MSVKEIATALDASVRTVRDRWVHAPDFPRPALQPSPYKRRWLKKDVLKWAKREAAKPAQTAARGRAGRVEAAGASLLNPPS